MAISTSSGGVVWGCRKIFVVVAAVCWVFMYMDISTTTPCTQKCTTGHFIIENHWGMSFEWCSISGGRLFPLTRCQSSALKEAPGYTENRGVGAVAQRLKHPVGVSLRSIDHKFSASENSEWREHQERSGATNWTRGNWRDYSEKTANLADWRRQDVPC